MKAVIIDQAGLPLAGTEKPPRRTFRCLAEAFPPDPVEYACAIEVYRKPRMGVDDWVAVAAGICALVLTAVLWCEA